MASVDELYARLEALCIRVEQAEGNFQREAAELKSVAKKLATLALQVQAARIAAAVVPGPLRMFYISLAAFCGGFVAQVAVHLVHIR